MTNELNEPDEQTQMAEPYGKSDISVPVQLASLASYFFPVAGGIFFLFVEKTNKLIRFHAAQSVLFWILFIILTAVAGVLESGLLSKLISIILLIAWIYVIYESLHKSVSKLPLIGDMAYKMIFKDEK